MKPFPRGACFVQQKIRCGKKVCRSCPHGPYWYAFWWERDSKRPGGGRTRSAYVGKKLPGGAERAAAEVARQLADPYKVLGVSKSAPADELRRAYRRRAFEVHPDRGGDHREMVLVNRAWESVRRERGLR